MPQLQVHERGPSRSALQAQSLAQSLGQLGQTIAGAYQQKQKQTQLADAFNKAKDLYNNPDIPQEQKVIGLFEAFQQHPEIAKNMGGLLGQADKANAPLTPYQQEQIRQKDQHLKIQENRINTSRDKSKEDQRTKTPNMISRYTQNYFHDFHFKPDEKVELDKYVQEAFDNGEDLNGALKIGVDRLKEKHDLLDNATIVDRPSGYFSTKEIPLAMEEMTEVLQTLHDNGITDRQTLQKVAMKGKWRKPEVDEMLDNVKNRPMKKKQAPEKEKSVEKIAFNPNNPEHAARRQQVLQEVKGDRAKANEILGKEFTR